MNLYGVSEKQYGLIFSVIVAGLIGSSQLNNIILKKYNSVQIIKAVFFSQSALGLILIAGIALDLWGFTLTIILMFLFLICQGFTFPNAAALAMAPFSKGAGSASALMGALQMGCGAIASALVGLFFNIQYYPWPLLWPVAVYSD